MRPLCRPIHDEQQTKRQKHDIERAAIKMERLGESVCGFGNRRCYELYFGLPSKK